MIDEFMSSVVGRWASERTPVQKDLTSLNCASTALDVPRKIFG